MIAYPVLPDALAHAANPDRQENTMTTNQSPPMAEVIAVRSGSVDIRCPYCRGTHTHPTAPSRVAVDHRAPQCGIGLNPTDRELGYCFVTPTTH